MNIFYSINISKPINFFWKILKNLSRKFYIIYCIRYAKVGFFFFPNFQPLKDFLFFQVINVYTLPIKIEFFSFLV